MPKFKPHQVRKKLEQIKSNKATAPGDIPSVIIKKFAQYISVPLCDILNTCISEGQWPDFYKIEAITPIPKQFPTTDVSMLRPISLLFYFEKVLESLVGELMVSDMKQNLDPSQYGNKKKISINHYLIRMLHRIVTCLDNNQRGEINAILCLFIDYKAAFSRMCHNLGIKSFIDNGVRPSIIPALISYYENREMFVKWHGKTSSKRKMPGSGAMGATFGILEFLSQTNDNEENIPIENRFKYFDDLTILEIVNLVNIGMSCLNFKSHVPSDMPEHGQYIDKQNLMSQTYLQELNEWSNNHKMVINQKKTKAMIFNFTKMHQFTTRLSLKEENIEIIDGMKLLGTHIQNDLSWDKNCSELIKKVNARMQLLNKCKEIGSNREEMVKLWILYCRSILETSCIVWGSSLTNENIQDLERLQKSFCKMVLEKKYSSYEQALIQLNLNTLEQRRKQLCLNFAEDAVKYETMTDIFIKNKCKQYDLRKHENFQVFQANTERKRKFAVIQMQHLLNENQETKR